MELTVLPNNFSFISDEYSVFAQEKDKCRKCSLYSEYKTIVHGEGNAKDPIAVFVGESPGKDEVTERKPFVGLAGKLLREELKKYKSVLNKKTMFITNTLSCRPLNNVFPSDKSLACICPQTWLSRELETLQPKVVVAVGSQSMNFLAQETGITKLRGIWKTIKIKNDFMVDFMPIYHPSYVLRKKTEPEIILQFQQDIAVIANRVKQLLIQQSCKDFDSL